MIRIRSFETAIQEAIKKGQGPGFVHLYLGEEAVAVGVCGNLRPDDYITSTHRGHGHALAKGLNTRKAMAELFGKATGCCAGRGGGLHLYDPAIGLLGSNGIVAGSIPLAVGAALGIRERKTDQVAISFFGDGASNHGAFLESINFAAIQNLPIIFVCENNLYATATPLAMATRTTDIFEKAAAFGIPGVKVDGNDVLAVFETAGQAVTRARNGKGPTLIEAKTYRVCAHSEGDSVAGTYRSWEELNSWKQRCPIASFRNLLLKETPLDELKKIEDGIEKEINEAVEFALSSPDPDPGTIHDHVWAEPFNPSIPPLDSKVETTQQGWMDAVRDGIAEEMRRNPQILYLGEGVGERGGCYGHTKKLWEEFGGGRVIDTPICELAFTGAAIGASATGSRSVADLMFADFLFEAGSPIVNQAAKLRYMSNGQVSAPVVIRAPMGMIKNASAHHSGCYYPAWAHVPGLVVAVPSTPHDAKGLIKTALRGGNPVIFLEHKMLFGTKGQVPADEYLVPFGQAGIVRKGKDLTVVTCGLLTQYCVTGAEKLQEKGLSCEVIDLRTIMPLDIETIARSVSKTRYLLIVDEAWSAFGVGAEITAAMMETTFDELDGPIGRLHTEPVTWPYSYSLFGTVGVTVEKITAAAENVVKGKVPKQKRPAIFNLPSRSDPLPKKPIIEKPRTSQTSDGIPFVLPDISLTVTEAKVVRWLAKPSDPIKAGQKIIEIETEKAVSEIESPMDGILFKITAAEGTVVPVGGELGIIQPAV